MGVITPVPEDDQRIEALLDSLHKGQERYIFAPDPNAPDALSRQTSLLSPTRWGKTDGFLRYACARAQIKPGYSALAVGIKTNAMRDICWPKLLDLKDDYRLPAQPNKLELALDFPRMRSRVRIFGADHPLAARLIRGQEHDDILVDEAQDFRHMNLQYLCETICMSRLSDRFGRLWMSGTPGPVEAGYFYDVVWKQSNKLWVAVHGRPYENHHNEKAQRALDAAYQAANPNCVNEGWYQRERLGLWTVDARHLLVSLDPKQTYLGKGEWAPHADDRYVLGIRWGFSKPSGYVLGVWNPRRYPYLVYLEGWRDQLSLRDHLQRIDGYRRKYERLQIYVQVSGPARTVIDELRTEHKVPVNEAPRPNDDFHEDKVQSDASLGLIKVYNRNDPEKPADNGVAAAWRTLAWHVNPETNERHAPDGRQIHDAALIVRRTVNLSLFKPPEPAPTFQDIARMSKAERRRALAEVN
jgi:hypothetical protein